MTISDFTELATRLYFWADLQGARGRALRPPLGIFVAGGDADDRPEAQVGEDLGAVQFDQLGALRPAVVGEQVELEAFGRPDEHHHDAGVGGGHEGILRRQNTGVPLRIGRGGEIHLRAVAHDDMTPVFALSRRRWCCRWLCGSFGCSLLRTEGGIFMQQGPRHRHPLRQAGSGCRSSRSPAVPGRIRRGGFAGLTELLEDERQGDQGDRLPVDDDLLHRDPGTAGTGRLDRFLHNRRDQSASTAPVVRFQCLSQQFIHQPGHFLRGRLHRLPASLVQAALPFRSFQAPFGNELGHHDAGSRLCRSTSRCRAPHSACRSRRWRWSGRISQRPGRLHRRPGRAAGRW